MLRLVRFVQVYPLLFCVVIGTIMLGGCASTDSYSSSSTHNWQNSAVGVINAMCTQAAKMEAANCVKQGFKQDGTSTFHAYQCGSKPAGIYNSVENINDCKALDLIYYSTTLPSQNMGAQRFSQQHLLQYAYPNCGANFIDDLYSCQFEGKLDSNNRPAVEYQEITDACYYTKGLEKQLCLCKKYNQQCHVVLGL
ncbi:MAG: hypothetical protein GJ680_06840 [Alteromonadaceae bacterium]|nr:hypothetical protein [Alteromonadaceae bacterium]